MTLRHHHTVQPSWCGRCFTYPQGAVSFLPQILAAAAFFGTLATFSTWTPLEDHWIKRAPDFLCLLIKLKTETSTDQQDSDPATTTDGGGGTVTGNDDDPWTYDHKCIELTFHDTEYWDVTEDDFKWAWAIRLACLIAILVAITGGAATFVLWSATCFSLPARKLAKIAATFFVCAPLCILTLIAGGTNLCKLRYPEEDHPDLECKRNGTGVRLSHGATTMIFVSILYLFAGIATMSYRSAVLNGQTGEEDDDDTADTAPDKHETIPLVHGGDHSKSSASPVVRTTIRHKPNGTTVTTKETRNPDGSKTVEIIEDETTSPSSSPTPSPSRKSPRRRKKKVMEEVEHGVAPEVAAIPSPPLDDMVA